MKTFFTSCLLLLVSYSITSAEPTSYEVIEVVEDIYLLKPKFSPYRWVTSNIIVIINENDVLVVDSGLTPSAAESAILEITKITQKPVKYLINTHWHGDHWQGNEAFVKKFPSVEIITCEAGYAALQRNGQLWVKRFYPKYLQLMVEDYQKMLTTKKFSDGTPMTPEDIANCKQGIEMVKSDINEINNLQPTMPTLTFKEKLTLRLGKREIQLHYLGIGNTTGDVIIYLPNEKILIPGDLVVYPSPYESGTFSRDWIQTLNRLQSFECNFLIPGHGKLQTDTLYLNYLNDLFVEIARQINEAFESGKTTLEEAKSIVTHESVTAELSKNLEYTEFLKRLSPSFVSEALRSSFHQAILGQL